ncbi:MAG TPA: hypothetical protein DIW24_10240 [Bacteroidetes bacterium]|nr:hypothetical protein [Bacteroidota bacterium]
MGHFTLFWIERNIWHMRSKVENNNEIAFCAVGKALVAIYNFAKHKKERRRIRNNAVGMKVLALK